MVADKFEILTMEMEEQETTTRPLKAKKKIMLKKNAKNKNLKMKNLKMQETRALKKESSTIIF